MGVDMGVDLAHHEIFRAKDGKGGINNLIIFGDCVRQYHQLSDF